MKKTKEEAELTRKHLLQAAFRLFKEDGYDRTSLEQICRDAQMTRGAAYWHFKNKREIFECTVVQTLEKIHTCVSEKTKTNKNLSDEEIIVELLCFPSDMEEEFSFIRKTTTYVQGKEEFDNLRQILLADKKRQYSYFLEPIKRIKERERRLDNISLDQLTFLIFYAFDGIYIQDIPKDIRIHVDRELIRKYIYLLLKA